MTERRPVDRLRHAMAVLRRDGGRDALAAAEAFENYLEHASEGLTLDMALGLSPAPGQTPWWEAEARAARDAAIRKMRDERFAHLSIRQSARQIAQIGRRRQAAASRGVTADAVTRLVDQALATGMPFPSERRIRSILGREG